MRLFDRFNFNSTKETPSLVPGVKLLGENIYMVDTVELSDLNTYYPSNVYSWYTGGKKWVPFGKNNLFPIQLMDLYYSSPLHSTIIEMKSKMMAGDIDLTGLDSRSIMLLNSMFSKGTSLTYKLREVCLDWQIFGAFAFEIIWNINFTAILSVRRIPVMNIRLGVENEKREITNFYYRPDWRPGYSNSEVEIPRFDPENKTSQTQLLYIKNPSLDGRYYGVPTYTSGLNSIAADAAISVYQLSVVENGFNPGLLIKFYKKPNSPEQKRDWISGLEKTYGGKKKAGKAMVLFSDGKELAPDVVPIDVSNLDKQFTVLEGSINSKVIFAHNAVSGILYGDKTTGQLGATNEYENAFRILDKTVVGPDRKILEEVINNLLSYNNIPPIEIKPFIVFDEIKTNPQP